MEPPRRLAAAELALALTLLAAVFGAARIEQRSSVAAAVRTGQPWTCWLALKSPKTAWPSLFFLLYQPARQSLDLIYLPETTALPGGATLSRAYAAARRQGAAEVDAAKAMASAAQAAMAPLLPTGPARSPHFHYDAMSDGDEPPIAARRWLAGSTRSPGLRRAVIARMTARGPEAGLGGFELLRIGLEIHGLDDERLRTSYLPGKEDRAAYFARLIGAAAQDQEREASREITVEILNSTQRKGVASQATKILRSKGADVVSTANAAAQPRTVVYDRIGRPEFAAKVRRMLGCPSAEAVTQIDAKRLVDVSVVLAGDCIERE